MGAGARSVAGRAVRPAGRILERPTGVRTQPSASETALDSMGDAIALVSDKVERWLVGLVAQLPNLIVAVLIVLAAWMVGRGVRGGLERALRRRPATSPLRTVALTLAQAAIVATGLFVALGVLGLDKTVTSLLAGVGIIGLALGLAFQDIAANFISGFILSVRHPFRVGHLVQTSEHLGVVSDVTLRTTVLRLLTGEYVRVPNRAVLNTPLVNYTQAGERRVDVRTRVGLAADLEHVRRIAIGAIEELPMRRRDRPVELYFDAFGESAIELVVQFWIPFARWAEYQTARSEAVIAVRRAFDREGIAIPFPVRSLDLARIGGASAPDALRPVLGEHGARGSGSDRVG